MSVIDRIGCYRGRIQESGVGTTKNGFPRFTCRLAATQRYIEDKAEMEAFGITEPGWVPWAEYDQEMTGYLTLFGKDKKSDDPTAMKQTFQFEAVQRATGWDGASFAVLGSSNYGEREITFWVEENTYEGNTSLQVSSIDAGDADPTRTINTLDGDGLKDLDSKFAGLMSGKKAAPAAASKTATAAKAPPGGKAPPGKPGAPAAATPKTTQAPAGAKPPAAPASPSKGPPKKPAAPAAKAEECPFDVATVTNQETAWDTVYNHKGAAEDDAIAEAWTKTCAAVAPGKDEADIQPAQWAEIASKTIKALKV